MGRRGFGELVEGVLEREFPGRWGAVPPALGCWVDNGLAIAYGDRAAQLRLGLAQGLALSSDLLRDLALVNTGLACGAVWVAEDAGGSWQVLWGERRAWSLAAGSPEETGAWVLEIARSVPSLVDVIAPPIIHRHGGRAWHRDLGPASAASLLMAIST